MRKLVVARSTSIAGTGTVISAFQEENYHKKLTDAIRDYVDGHKTFKYSTIIDMIYKAVFCEKAKGMINIQVCHVSFPDIRIGKLKFHYDFRRENYKRNYR